VPVIGFSPEEATILLLRCVDDPDSLIQPLETVRVLVEHLHADVNAKDAFGRTVMMSLFTNEEIGRYILQMGGDVLICDSEGASALSMSMDYGIDWMLEAFIDCKHEERLLEEGDAVRIHHYVTCLIMGGHAAKARHWLSRCPPPLCVITPEEATDLWSVCVDNMDNLKEALETFELLKNELGAMEIQ